MSRGFPRSVRTNANFHSITARVAKHAITTPRPNVSDRSRARWRRGDRPESEMPMRIRTRLILPTVQLAVAVCLMISNHTSHEDWAWTHADLQYCYALNSPVAAIVHLQRESTYELLKWHYPLNVIVNFGILFALVWLLWYAVSIEIGGKGLSVLTPKTGFRRLADLLAIAFGAAGYASLLYADQASAQIIYTPALYPILGPLHLIWALAIIGFYCHDFWVSFGKGSGGKIAA